MLNISNIFTNAAHSASQSIKQMTPVLIRFVPSVFAATICLGLKEQIPLISREVLNSANTRILEISTILFGCLALKSVWDGSKRDISGLSSRKIIKQNNVNEGLNVELAFLRQEVARLKKEIVDNDEKFNVRLSALRVELNNELKPFVDKEKSDSR